MKDNYTYAIDGEIQEQVDELPPSAKLVFKVLEYNGELTQKEIAEETRLSVRTVRYALNRLREAGLTTEFPSLKDGRRTLYDLNTENESIQENQTEVIENL